jgi:DNA (cytosine-5)-methyltransferase 1
MGVIKFIDLFAGIGGFRYGLEKCNGYQVGGEQPTKKREHEQRYVYTKSKQQAFRCVWSNEWDKYAASIYKKHYGECDTRDITTIPASDIPDHDLLCGGFPCQSFSIAGKRRGFDDTRGTLFFDIARILKEKQPRLCLLENVKGLLSHDNGNTFKTIISTLDELGYDLQWQVLNSKNFGVPQNRERVFIIGHLRGTSRPQVFPIGKNSQADIVLPTLTARYWGGQANGSYIGNKPKQIIGGSQGNRVYDTSGVSTTIASQAGGLGAKTGLYATRAPLKFLQRNQKNIKGDYSFTIDGANTGGVREGMKIRRLTPTECERLQGFPDGWTEGVSDTQRYKMLGNAVTTNVITWIGSQLNK